MILDEITAYHGSPIDFDKFDITFLGTGEGHQSHGLGLYFALDRKISKERYSTLHNKLGNYIFLGKTYSLDSVEGMILDLIYRKKNPKIKSAFKQLLSDKEWVKSHPNVVERIKKIISKIKGTTEDSYKIEKIKEKIKLKKGQLYTVEIPDTDYYFREDKSYNDQPRTIQYFLKKAGIKASDCNRPNKEISEKMYSAGIKGILYHGGTDGWCVVLFSDKDVKILNKEYDYKIEPVGTESNNSLKLYKDIELNEISKITAEELNDLPEKIQIKIVKKRPGKISDIRNPSEKVQMAAVKKHPQVIRFIHNPSEEVQLRVLSIHPTELRYIDNPTEKAQILAVKQWGGAIQLIDNPSEEVQMTAVKHKYAPELIKYIDNPTEKVQMEILDSVDPTAIRYIKKPTAKVQLAAVKMNPKLVDYINSKYLTKTAKNYAITHK